MKSYRENPDGEENTAASKQHERDVFASKMQQSQQHLGRLQLIACPECGKLPELAEEELSEGMEATIQCPNDCNTVVGPTQWAIMEWNKTMVKTYETR